jgi:hypothetical protein
VIVIELCNPLVLLTIVERLALVACRRDNVTADAAGRIGIFPLDLPELLHDAADSG